MSMNYKPAAISGTIILIYKYDKRDSKHVAKVMTLLYY